jgi:hypothetical protein
MTESADEGLDRDPQRPARPAAGQAAHGPATLMRIFAGRPAGLAAYELSGAAPAELVVF